MLQGCAQGNDRRVSATPPPVPSSVGAPSSSSRVISPGPAYYGTKPVKRLSIYMFIDFRTEYVNQELRNAVADRLGAALSASGVPNQVVWFTETRQGRGLLAAIKSHTFSNVTSIPVGRTIAENRPSEREFAATHRLIVFPTNTIATGQNGTVEMKWDIRDASTDYVEWSVYTQTTRLSAAMADDQARDAASSLAAAIIGELRARAVIPSPAS
jgi:hypothetical protein